MQTANSIGRLHCEIKTPVSHGVILALLTALLLGAGLLSLTPPADSVIAVITLIPAAILALLTASTFIKRLQCCEHGVISRSLFGTKALRYDDIVSFSHKATRQYYNGIPTGTEVRLVLNPRPQRGSQIKFTKHTFKGDPKLEELRDALAQHVADRLYRELPAGARVQWTPHAELSREGLHFHERKMFGQGAPITIPFDQPLQYRIDQGHCDLWVANSNLPSLRLDCAAANFFPGFILFGRLVNERFDHQRRESKAEVGFNKAIFGSLAAGKKPRFGQ